MEIVLAVLSVVLIISVFITFIRKDYWLFKILEYPRLLKLAIVTTVLLSWLFYWPMEPVYMAIAGGLFIGALYLVYKIFPYTPFRKEMKRARGADKGNEVKIFTGNVLQENTRYADMLQQIRSVDPDVVFLLETDKKWASAMQALVTEYPHTLLAPQENTYGLLFYSRLPLEDAKVQFIVKSDIPSVRGTLVLGSGAKVQFWGLHPEPPVPGESLYSTARDKELMKVALEVKKCKVPAVVFGDLNDVAWSHTTELFRKASETLDPRRGRGFYNSFSAHNWFVRFPLDYIFCTGEFGLVRMRRLPKNGSDHFAMFIHLAIMSTDPAIQEAPVADEEEMDEAKKLASQPVKE